MININEETLKALILKTEPGFLSQAELQINNFGFVRALNLHETTWVWSRERFKELTREDFDYLVTKIIE